MSKSLLSWQLNMQAGHYSTVTIEGYLPSIKRVIEFQDDPDAADVTV